MSVIYIVLPLAFVLAGAALWACILAIRGGQFDDLQTPPMRMLGDDVPVGDRNADDSESVSK